MTVDELVKELTEIRDSFSCGNSEVYIRVDGMHDIYVSNELNTKDVPVSNVGTTDSLIPIIYIK